MKRKQRQYWQKGANTRQLGVTVKYYRASDKHHLNFRVGRLDVVFRPQNLNRIPPNLEREPLHASSLERQPVSSRVVWPQRSPVAISPCSLPTVSRIHALVTH